ncbi:MAG: T9SS type A sorting domain-containing protein [Bacteroidota bacterium]|nr:T9SS type A sorting domain-containing protein [Bacteroidota bacterium]
MKKIKIIIVLILFAGCFKAQHQFTNYGNLTIHPGASITVIGNFINNGVLLDSGSVLYFAGSAPQEIGGTSTSTFKNVVLNNTAGSFLSANANISKELNITAGTFSATGFALKLLSDQNGTARIAPIIGDFSGNITMERYLPTGITDWRFLAAPVTGVTLNDWQDDFITSGFTGSSYPNFPFVSIYTYDETIPGTNENGYNGATNATNSIVPGMGYWCYVGPSPLTVDLTGPPVKFNQTFSVSYSPSAGTMHDGWVMIGNPYPSAIDWSSPAWTKNNINNAVYIWNPALQQYASWVAGVGTNGGSNIIASSQSFWVQTNAANPTLTCTEYIKSSTDQPFMKTNNNIAPSFMKLTLGGNLFTDETYIRFDNSATNQYDAAYDARKIISSNTLVPGLSTQDITNADLSINSLPAITNSLNITVKTVVGVAGTYTITGDSMVNMPLGFCIVLEDLATTTKTNLRNTTSYTFTISDTTIAPRFVLHIGTPISLSSISTECNADSNGQVIAKGTGAGPWDYLWYNNSNTLLKTTTNTSVADTLKNVVAGIYKVNINDPNSMCGQISNSIIVSEPVPVISGFTLYKYMNNGIFTDSIMVNNISSGASTYVWDFGDGSALNTNANPGNHTYYNIGNYTLALIATNNNCSSTSTNVVSVTSPIMVLENTLNSLITIFPNPSNGNFYIVSQSQLTEDTYLEIHDIAGRKILKTELNSIKTKVDLSHNAKGIYFLKITSLKQIFNTKLIIE